MPTSFVFLFFFFLRITYICPVATCFVWSLTFGFVGCTYFSVNSVMSSINTFLPCSLPQKPSAGPLTPSTGSCRSLQMKARRPSALPTPVRRRMSAIPVATPTNQNRHTRPPLDSHSVPCPASAKRERSCRWALLTSKGLWCYCVKSPFRYHDNTCRCLTFVVSL